jgi:hypothetical protein
MPLTTTRIDGEVDIRLEKEGPASWEPKTVFQVIWLDIVFL